MESYIMSSAALPPSLPSPTSPVMQTRPTGNTMVEQPLLVLRRPQPPGLTLKHVDNRTFRLQIPNQNRNPKDDNIRFEEDDKEESTSRRRGRRRCRPSDMLRLMDALHIPVDTELYVSLAAECTRTRDTAEAAALYAHIRATAPRPDAVVLFLGNRLLLMLAACSMHREARQLFTQMAGTSTAGDVVSFAVMIAAMVINIGGGGEGEGSDNHKQVCNLFVEMLVRSSTNYVNRKKKKKKKKSGGRTRYLQLVLLLRSAVLVRKSCARWGDAELAQQIDGLILKMDNNILSSVDCR